MEPSICILPDAKTSSTEVYSNIREHGVWRAMKRERVTFPKAGEKHSFKAVIRAESAVRGFYRKGRVPAAPPKAVLIFDRNLEASLLDLDWLEEAPGLYAMSSRSLKSVDGRLGVYKLGIGAPMTSIAVEELVVQGAREFLILGTAGGITTFRPGGLVLCTKALRDEGVSHHYLPNSRYAVPDRGLTRGLGEAMKMHGISFQSGPSWTIDAPYRESKRERAQYAKEGILTVEMEGAALFAVANVVGARAAAVFMVSDLLTEDGWTGLVKGRRPQDFATLARVAEVFRLLQPVKRYNRERTA